MHTPKQALPTWEWVLTVMPPFAPTEVSLCAVELSMLAWVPGRPVYEPSALAASSSAWALAVPLPLLCGPWTV